jgi:hypothetical protein
VQFGVRNAEFVEANVYDAKAALGGRTFDIVYTGLGALVWLPDITRWAEAAASLVAPGGFLYLAEFHPFSQMFDEDGRTVEVDYFEAKPQVYDDAYTCTDGDGTNGAPVNVQWQHGLGEIVTALGEQGLRIELLREHDYTLFPQFSTLEEQSGWYRFPHDRPRIPLILSLRAARAA